ncbi:MAG: type I-E CRISPR-associated protein Cse1/CasA, partial [Anaerolineae bacterium]
LTAILQDVLRPRHLSDLVELRRAGQFPVEDVRAFGERYAGRFDLFSPDTPFMQSADLPLQPDERDKTKKTVAYLAPEMPTGTGIIHYRHSTQDAQVFCPTCAAGGLVATPAFASSGGAGIKPSINGVPPIYVLPGGRSLFESLASSVLLPKYLPTVASKKDDAAWWKRQPIVERRHEIHKVGYLHSLTFPARRVRLHPQQTNASCTRCGQFTEWGVRTMVFQMGESRPKDAPFWFDPFAAYRLPSGKSARSKQPTPIRPVLGRATWREFANLFLLQPEASRKTLRPRVVDQMAELEEEIGLDVYPFRCVGLRTDMKAKIFEWIDADHGVPQALLDDIEGGMMVGRAIQFATDCAGIISSVFRRVFGGQSQKGERYQRLKLQMRDDYWASLADAFREFVLAIANPNQREDEERRWLDEVVAQAQAAFKRAAEDVGDDAASLRQRVQGTIFCDKLLYSKRKEYIPDEKE